MALRKRFVAYLLEQRGGREAHETGVAKDALSEFAQLASFRKSDLCQGLAV